MTYERTEGFTLKPWQMKVSRRGFLGGGAALAGAAALAGVLPENLARAAAAPAPSKGKFDLSQIKHLVFLMQENRSFDHYFGTFPGVRGFSDRNIIKLPNGRPVWQQPDPSNPDGYLEPFRMDTVSASGDNFTGTSHDWRIQHASWNNGKLDSWLRSHIAADSPGHGPYVMGYHTQEDIPFHWALAEAFTLADHYHCSVLGPTHPNRVFWSTGTNDPQGLAGGPVLETYARTNLGWETGAETMYNAGITFKQYLPDATQWSYFTKFRSATTLPAALYNSAVVGGTLWGDGTPGGVGDPANPTAATNPNMAFQEDCANGVLPDVSFIGTLQSEHPGNGVASIAKGAEFLAQILDALAANEDLWNTTAFIINYDENDGWFDHVPPPVPNKSEFPEEFVTKASQPGTPGGGYPVGGGFRVPAFVISPWTTGGQIFSQLSDHTSCLQLIESVAAAGGLSGRNTVRFPNISRWRRQTFGDLTAAFAGKAQPAPTSPEFDPTVRAQNVTQHTASSSLPLPPLPGADQTMPHQ